MTALPPPSPGSGSTLRFLAGIVMIAIALAVAVLGFARLITVLEAGGYGTTAMRVALVTLGVAGAFLAAGVATVIWHIAKRYESR